MPEENAKNKPSSPLGTLGLGALATGLTITTAKLGYNALESLIDAANMRAVLLQIQLTTPATNETVNFLTSIANNLSIRGEDYTMYAGGAAFLATIAWAATYHYIRGK